MKKVEITREIEQVENGYKYKGFLTIAGVKFEYGINFYVAIPKLDELAVDSITDVVRKLYRVSLKKDETAIEISENELPFFLAMVGSFAVDFFNMPQTQANNEGPLGRFVRGEPFPNCLGFRSGKCTLRTSDTGTYQLPDDVCEFLGSPKYGCPL